MGRSLLCGEIFFFVIRGSGHGIPRRHAHNPSFYFSIGAQVLITLVLLGLVIVGIVIAVRAKTETGKGCGIVMAVAFALQSCLAAFFFLISFFAGKGR